MIGGGTQWRKYIDIDAEDTKSIKFKYDYQAYGESLISLFLRLTDLVFHL